MSRDWNCLSCGLVNGKSSQFCIACYTQKKISTPETDKPYLIYFSDKLDNLCCNELILLLDGYSKENNNGKLCPRSIITIIHEYVFNSPYNMANKGKIGKTRKVILKWDNDNDNSPFGSLDIPNNVIVTCNTWIFNKNNNDGILLINAYTVINNGKINVDGKGYYGFNGVGYGSTKTVETDIYVGGGSYGTSGTVCQGHYHFLSQPGLTYGNKYLNKIYFGCGSTHYKCKKGKGGGGIIIIYCNKFINNGIIGSNGYSQKGSYPYGYGGSGGSILIVSKIFVNNKGISCIGASSIGFDEAGCGGYGRIGIYSDNIMNIGIIKPTPYKGNFNDGYKILKNIITKPNIYINPNTEIINYHYYKEL